MVKHPDQERALSPYRVLDLTEEGCLICSKLLGDLGADVIKIEPPKGSPSRNIGPFYKDIAHPEKSLFWFAYCANKRGITLNLDSSDGRSIFKRLVAGADFVIESFAPGFMAGLGLGYEELSRMNPRLVMTSITPYGQTGPKSGHKASDLTCWAAGGALFSVGEQDREPNWITFPQSYLHAGVEAATASMVAHWHREMTGEGQYVDVSAQATITRVLQAIIQMYDMRKYIYRRPGARQATALGVGRRLVYRCKDGFVALFVVGGGVSTAVVAARALIDWMAEEGMAPDWLKTFDWANEYEVRKLSQELVERVETPIEKFCMTKTKAELFEEALKRGVLLAPASDAKDLLEDTQLNARDFWSKFRHPELNDSLVYPGEFVKFSVTPATLRRRAPLVGEHNEEILKGELGYSEQDLVILKQAGAI